MLIRIRWPSSGEVQIRENYDSRGSSLRDVHRLALILGTSRMYVDRRLERDTETGHWMIATMQIGFS